MDPTPQASGDDAAIVLAGIRLLQAEQDCSVRGAVRVLVASAVERHMTLAEAAQMVLDATAAAAEGASRGEWHKYRAETRRLAATQLP
jgi:hypothetical protein